MGQCPCSSPAARGGPWRLPGDLFKFSKGRFSATHTSPLPPTFPSVGRTVCYGLVIKSVSTERHVKTTAMWGLQSIPGHIRPPCEGCACQGVAGQVRQLPALLLPMRARVLHTLLFDPSPGDRSGRACRELAQESKDTSNNRLSCWLIALRCYLQGWGVFCWLWSISPPLRPSLFPAPL